MKPNYKTIETYLISCLENGWDSSEPFNLKTALENFKADLKAGRYSRILNNQKALAELLAGLPSSLTIAFTYHEIEALAVAWGSLPGDYTEKQAEKIHENYWNFMAIQIIKLARKNKVDLFA